MRNHPCATDYDKKGLEQIKVSLHGRDALEIERRLAEADVKQDILDIIEKLNKDLAEMRLNDLQLLK